MREPIMRDGGFWNLWLLYDPDFDQQAFLERLKGMGGGVSTRGAPTPKKTDGWHVSAGAPISMEYLFPKK